MIAKCEGIVIRTVDYGESAKVVTIFSKELGKVTVMAHGAKKFKSKLSGVTQLFHYGYYLFHAGSGMGTLQQGETIRNFREINQDIILTAYASYMLELVDKTTEDRETDLPLFNFLLISLNYIDNGYDPECIKFIFELKMLSMFGVEPYFDGCVCCKTTLGHFLFSLEEGGLICSACAPQDQYAIRISPRVAKILRVFAHVNLERLGEIDLSDESKSEIKCLLDSYYERNVGTHFKSKKFLAQIENMNNLVVKR